MRRFTLKGKTRLNNTISFIGEDAVREKDHILSSLAHEGGLSTLHKANTVLETANRRHRSTQEEPEREDIRNSTQVNDSPKFDTENRLSCRRWNSSDTAEDDSCPSHPEVNKKKPGSSILTKGKHSFASIARKIGIASKKSEQSTPNVKDYAYLEEIPEHGNSQDEEIACAISPCSGVYVLHSEEKHETKHDTDFQNSPVFMDRFTMSPDHFAQSTAVHFPSQQPAGCDLKPSEEDQSAGDARYSVSYLRASLAENHAVVNETRIHETDTSSNELFASVFDVNGMHFGGLLCTFPACFSGFPSQSSTDRRPQCGKMLRRKRTMAHDRPFYKRSGTRVDILLDICRAEDQTPCTIQDFLDYRDCSQPYEPRLQTPCECTHIMARYIQTGHRRNDVITSNGAALPESADLLFQMEDTELDMKNEAILEERDGYEELDDYDEEHYIEEDSESQQGVSMTEEPLLDTDLSSDTSDYNGQYISACQTGEASYARRSKSAVECRENILRLHKKNAEDYGSFTRYMNHDRYAGDIHPVASPPQDLLEPVIRHPTTHNEHGVTIDGNHVNPWSSATPAINSSSYVCIPEAGRQRDKEEFQHHRSDRLQTDMECITMNVAEFMEVGDTLENDEKYNDETHANHENRTPSPKEIISSICCGSEHSTKSLSTSKSNETNVIPETNVDKSFTKTTQEVIVGRRQEDKEYTAIGVKEIAKTLDALFKTLPQVLGGLGRYKQNAEEVTEPDPVPAAPRRQNSRPRLPFLEDIRKCSKTEASPNDQKADTAASELINKPTANDDQGIKTSDQSDQTREDHFYQLLKGGNQPRLPFAHDIRSRTNKKKNKGVGKECQLHPTVISINTKAFTPRTCPKLTPGATQTSERRSLPFLEELEIRLVKNEYSAFSISKSCGEKENPEILFTQHEASLSDKCGHVKRLQSEDKQVNEARVEKSYLNPNKVNNAVVNITSKEGDTELTKDGILLNYMSVTLDYDYEVIDEAKTKVKHSRIGETASNHPLAEIVEAGDELPKVMSEDWFNHTQQTRPIGLPSSHSLQESSTENVPAGGESPRVMSEESLTIWPAYHVPSPEESTGVVENALLEETQSLSPPASSVTHLKVEKLTSVLSACVSDSTLSIPHHLSATESCGSHLIDNTFPKDLRVCASTQDTVSSVPRPPLTIETSVTHSQDELSTNDMKVLVSTQDTTLPVSSSSLSRDPPVMHGQDTLLPCSRKACSTTQSSSSVTRLSSPTEPSAMALQDILFKGDLKAHSSSSDEELSPESCPQPFHASSLLDSEASNVLSLLSIKSTVDYDKKLATQLSTANSVPSWPPWASCLSTSPVLQEWIPTISSSGQITSTDNYECSFDSTLSLTDSSYPFSQHYLRLIISNNADSCEGSETWAGKEMSVNTPVQQTRYSTGSGQQRAASNSASQGRVSVKTTHNSEREGCFIFGDKLFGKPDSAATTHPHLQAADTRRLNNDSGIELPCSLIEDDIVAELDGSQRKESVPSGTNHLRCYGQNKTVTPEMFYAAKSSTNLKDGRENVIKLDHEAKRTSDIRCSTPQIFKMSLETAESVGRSLHDHADFQRRRHAAQKSLSDSKVKNKIFSRTCKSQELSSSCVMAKRVEFGKNVQLSDEPPFFNSSSRTKENSQPCGDDSFRSCLIKSDLDVDTKEETTKACQSQWDVFESLSTDSSRISVVTAFDETPRATPIICSYSSDRPKLPEDADGGHSTRGKNSVYASRLICSGFPSTSQGGKSTGTNTDSKDHPVPETNVVMHNKLQSEESTPEKRMSGRTKNIESSQTSSDLCSVSGVLSDLTTKFIKMFPKETDMLRQSSVRSSSVTGIPDVCRKSNKAPEGMQNSEVKHDHVQQWLSAFQLEVSPADIINEDDSAYFSEVLQDELKHPETTQNSREKDVDNVTNTGIEEVTKNSVLDTAVTSKDKTTENLQTPELSRKFLRESVYNSQQINHQSEAKELTDPRIPTESSCPKRETTEAKRVHTLLGSEKTVLRNLHTLTVKGMPAISSADEKCMQHLPITEESVKTLPGTERNDANMSMFSFVKMGKQVTGDSPISAQFESCNTIDYGEVPTPSDSFFSIKSSNTPAAFDELLPASRFSEHHDRRLHKKVSIIKDMQGARISQKAVKEKQESRIFRNINTRKVKSLESISSAQARKFPLEVGNYPDTSEFTVKKLIQSYNVIGSFIKFVLNHPRVQMQNSDAQPVSLVDKWINSQAEKIISDLSEHMSQSSTLLSLTTEKNPAPHLRNDKTCYISSAVQTHPHLLAPLTPTSVQSFPSNSFNEFVPDLRSRNISGNQKSSSVSSFTRKVSGLGKTVRNKPSQQERVVMNRDRSSAQSSQSTDRGDRDLERTRHSAHQGTLSLVSISKDGLKTSNLPLPPKSCPRKDTKPAQREKLSKNETIRLDMPASSRGDKSRRSISFAIRSMPSVRAFNEHPNDTPSVSISDSEWIASEKKQLISAFKKPRGSLSDTDICKKIVTFGLNHYKRISRALTKRDFELVLPMIEIIPSSNEIDAEEQSDEELIFDTKTSPRPSKDATTGKGIPTHKSDEVKTTNGMDSPVYTQGVKTQKATGEPEVHPEHSPKPSADKVTTVGKPVHEGEQAIRRQRKKGLCGVRPRSSPSDEEVARIMSEDKLQPPHICWGTDKELVVHELATSSEENAKLPSTGKKVSTPYPFRKKSENSEVTPACRSPEEKSQRSLNNKESKTSSDYTKVGLKDFVQPKKNTAVFPSTHKNTKSSPESTKTAPAKEMEYLKVPALRKRKQSDRQTPKPVRKNTPYTKSTTSSEKEPIYTEIKSSNTELICKERGYAQTARIGDTEPNYPQTKSNNKRQTYPQTPRSDKERSYPQPARLSHTRSNDPQTSTPSLKEYSDDPQTSRFSDTEPQHPQTMIEGNKKQTHPQTSRSRDKEQSYPPTGRSSATGSNYSQKSASNNKEYSYPQKSTVSDTESYYSQGEEISSNEQTDLQRPVRKQKDHTIKKQEQLPTKPLPLYTTERQDVLERATRPEEYPDERAVNREVFPTPQMPKKKATTEGRDVISNKHELNRRANKQYNKRHERKGNEIRCDPRSLTEPQCRMVACLVKKLVGSLQNNKPDNRGKKVATVTVKDIKSTEIGQSTSQSLQLDDSPFDKEEPDDTHTSDWSFQELVKHALHIVGDMKVRESTSHSPSHSSFSSVSNKSRGSYVRDGPLPPSRLVSVLAGNTSGTADSYSASPSMTFSSGRVSINTEERLTHDSDSRSRCFYTSEANATTTLNCDTAGSEMTYKMCPMSADIRENLGKLEMMYRFLQMSSGSGHCNQEWSEESVHVPASLGDLLSESCPFSEQNLSIVAKESRDHVVNRNSPEMPEEIQLIENAVFETVLQSFENIGCDEQSPYQSSIEDTPETNSLSCSKTDESEYICTFEERNEDSLMRLSQLAVQNFDNNMTAETMATSSYYDTLTHSHQSDWFVLDDTFPIVHCAMPSPSPVSSDYLQDATGVSSYTILQHQEWNKLQNEVFVNSTRNARVLESLISNVDNKRSAHKDTKHLNKIVTEKEEEAKNASMVLQTQNSSRYSRLHAKIGSHELDNGLPRVTRSAEVTQSTSPRKEKVIYTIGKSSSDQDRFHKSEKNIDSRCTVDEKPNTNASSISSPFKTCYKWTRPISTIECLRTTPRINYSYFPYRKEKGVTAEGATKAKGYALKRTGSKSVWYGPIAVKKKSCTSQNQNNIHTAKVFHENDEFSSPNTERGKPTMSSRRTERNREEKASKQHPNRSVTHTKSQVGGKPRRQSLENRKESRTQAAIMSPLDESSAVYLSMCVVSETVDPLTGRPILKVTGTNKEPSSPYSFTQKRTPALARKPGCCSESVRYLNASSPSSGGSDTLFSSSMSDNLEKNSSTPTCSDSFQSLSVFSEEENAVKNIPKSKGCRVCRHKKTRRPPLSHLSRNQNAADPSPPICARSPTSFKEHHLTTGSFTTNWPKPRSGKRAYVLHTEPSSPELKKNQQICTKTCSGLNQASKLLPPWSPKMATMSSISSDPSTISTCSSREKLSISDKIHFFTRKINHSTKIKASKRKDLSSPMCYGTQVKLACEQYESTIKCSSNIQLRHAGFSNQFSISSRSGETQNKDNLDTDKTDRTKCARCPSCQTTENNNASLKSIRENAFDNDSETTIHPGARSLSSLWNHTSRSSSSSNSETSKTVNDSQTSTHPRSRKELSSISDDTSLLDTFDNCSAGSASLNELFRSNKAILIARTYEKHNEVNNRRNEIKHENGSEIVTFHSFKQPNDECGDIGASALKLPANLHSDTHMYKKSRRQEIQYDPCIEGYTSKLAGKFSSQTNAMLSPVKMRTKYHRQQRHDKQYTEAQQAHNLKRMNNEVTKDSLKVSSEHEACNTNTFSSESETFSVTNLSEKTCKTCKTSPINSPNSLYERSETSTTLRPLRLKESVEERSVREGSRSKLLNDIRRAMSAPSRQTIDRTEELSQRESGCILCVSQFFTNAEAEHPVKESFFNASDKNSDNSASSGDSYATAKQGTRPRLRHTLRLLSQEKRQTSNTGKGKHSLRRLDIADSSPRPIIYMKGKKVTRTLPRIFCEPIQAGEPAGHAVHSVRTQSASSIKSQNVRGGFRRSHQSKDNESPSQSLTENRLTVDESTPGFFGGQRDNSVATSAGNASEWNSFQKGIRRKAYYGVEPSPKKKPTDHFRTPVQLPISFGSETPREINLSPSMLTVPRPPILNLPKYVGKVAQLFMNTCLTSTSSKCDSPGRRSPRSRETIKYQRIARNKFGRDYMQSMPRQCAVFASAERHRSGQFEKMCSYSDRLAIDRRQKRSFSHKSDLEEVNNNSPVSKDDTDPVEFKSASSVDADNRSETRIDVLRSIGNTGNSRRSRSNTSGTFDKRRGVLDTTQIVTKPTGLGKADEHPQTAKGTETTPVSTPILQTQKVGRNVCTLTIGLAVGDENNENNTKTNDDTHLSLTVGNINVSTCTKDAAPYSHFTDTKLVSETSATQTDKSYQMHLSKDNKGSTRKVTEHEIRESGKTDSETSDEYVDVSTSSKENTKAKTSAGSENVRRKNNLPTNSMKQAVSLPFDRWKIKDPKNASKNKTDVKMETSSLSSYSSSSYETPGNGQMLAELKENSVLLDRHKKELKYVNKSIRDSPGHSSDCSLQKIQFQSRQVYDQTFGTSRNGAAPVTRSRANTKTDTFSKNESQSALKHRFVPTTHTKLTNISKYDYHTAQQIPESCCLLHCGSPTLRKRAVLSPSVEEFVARRIKTIGDCIPLQCVKQYGKRSTEPADVQKSTTTRFIVRVGEEQISETHNKEDNVCRHPCSGQAKVKETIAPLPSMDGGEHTDASSHGSSSSQASVVKTANLSSSDDCLTMRIKVKKSYVDHENNLNTLFVDMSTDERKLMKGEQPKGNNTCEKLETTNPNNGQESSKAGETNNGKENPKSETETNNDNPVELRLVQQLETDSNENMKEASAERTSDKLGAKATCPDQKCKCRKHCSAEPRIEILQPGSYDECFYSATKPKSRGPECLVFHTPYQEQADVVESKGCHERRHRKKHGHKKTSDFLELVESYSSDDLETLLTEYKSPSRRAKAETEAMLQEMKIKNQQKTKNKNPSSRAMYFDSHTVPGRVAKSRTQYELPQAREARLETLKTIEEAKAIARAFKETADAEEAKKASVQFDNSHARTINYVCETRRTSPRTIVKEKRCSVRHTPAPQKCAHYSYSTTRTTERVGTLPSLGEPCGSECMDLCTPYEDTPLLTPSDQTDSDISYVFQSCKPQMMHRSRSCGKRYLPQIECSSSSYDSSNSLSLCVSQKKTQNVNHPPKQRTKVFSAPRTYINRLPEGNPSSSISMKSALNDTNHVECGTAAAMSNSLQSCDQVTSQVMIFSPAESHPMCRYCLSKREAFSQNNNQGSIKQCTHKSSGSNRKYRVDNENNSRQPRKNNRGEHAKLRNAADSQNNCPCPLLRHHKKPEKFGKTKHDADVALAAGGENTDSSQCKQSSNSAGNRKYDSKVFNARSLINDRGFPAQHKETSPNSVGKQRATKKIHTLSSGKNNEMSCGKSVDKPCHCDHQSRCKHKGANSEFTEVKRNANGKTYRMIQLPGEEKNDCRKHAFVIQPLLNQNKAEVKEKEGHRDKNANKRISTRTLHEEGQQKRNENCDKKTLTQKSKDNQEQRDEKDENSNKKRQKQNGNTSAHCTNTNSRKTKFRITAEPTCDKKKSPTFKIELSPQSSNSSDEPRTRLVKMEEMCGPDASAKLTMTEFKNKSPTGKQALKHSFPPCVTKHKTTSDKSKTPSVMEIVSSITSQLTVSDAGTLSGIVTNVKQFPSEKLVSSSDGDEAEFTIETKSPPKRKKSSPNEPRVYGFKATIKHKGNSPPSPCITSVGACNVKSCQSSDDGRTACIKTLSTTYLCSKCDRLKPDSKIFTLKKYSQNAAKPSVERTISGTISKTSLCSCGKPRQGSSPKTKQVKCLAMRFQKEAADGSEPCRVIASVSRISLPIKSVSPKACSPRQRSQMNEMITSVPNPECGICSRNKKLRNCKRRSLKAQLSTSSVMDVMSDAMMNLKQKPFMLRTETGANKGIQNFRLAQKSNSSIVSIASSPGGSGHRLTTTHSFSVKRNTKMKRLYSSQQHSAKRLKRARRTLKQQETLANLAQNTQLVLSKAMRATRREIVDEKNRARQKELQKAMKRARVKRLVVESGELAAKAVVSKLQEVEANISSSTMEIPKEKPTCNLATKAYVRVKRGPPIRFEEDSTSSCVTSSAQELFGHIVDKLCSSCLQVSEQEPRYCGDTFRSRKNPCTCGCTQIFRLNSGNNCSPRRCSSEYARVDRNRCSVHGKRYQRRVTCRRSKSDSTLSYLNETSSEVIIRHPRRREPTRLQRENCKFSASRKPSPHNKMRSSPKQSVNRERHCQTNYDLNQSRQCHTHSGRCKSSEIVHTHQKYLSFLQQIAKQVATDAVTEADRHKGRKGRGQRRCSVKVCQSRSEMQYLLTLTDVSRMVAAVSMAAIEQDITRKWKSFCSVVLRPTKQLSFTTTRVCSSYSILQPSEAVCTLASRARTADVRPTCKQKGHSAQCRTSSSILLNSSNPQRPGRYSHLASHVSTSATKVCRRSGKPVRSATVLYKSDPMNIRNGAAHRCSSQIYQSQQHGYNDMLSSETTLSTPQITSTDASSVTDSWHGEETINLKFKESPTLRSNTTEYKSCQSLYPVNNQSFKQNTLLSESIISPAGDGARRNHHCRRHQQKTSPMRASMPYKYKPARDAPATVKASVSVNNETSSEVVATIGRGNTGFKTCRKEVSVRRKPNIQIREKICRRRCGKPDGDISIESVYSVVERRRPKVFMSALPENAQKSLQRHQRCRKPDDHGAVGYTQIVRRKYHRNYQPDVIATKKTKCYSSHPVHNIESHSEIYTREDKERDLHARFSRRPKLCSRPASPPAYGTDKFLRDYTEEHLSNNQRITSRKNRCFSSQIDVADTDAHICHQGERMKRRVCSSGTTKFHTSPAALDVDSDIINFSHEQNTYPCKKSSLCAAQPKQVRSCTKATAAFQSRSSAGLRNEVKLLVSHNMRKLHYDHPQELRRLSYHQLLHANDGILENLLVTTSADAVTLNKVFREAVYQSYLNYHQPDLCYAQDDDMLVSCKTDQF